MITTQEQQIINQALSILEREALNTPFISSPQAAGNYVRLKLSALEHEVFAVLFLNTQHQVINFEEMFRGTIDAASVYPREVAKAALKNNAASVVFAHNHPANTLEPSQADIDITKRLFAALELLDIRVLDHLIVTKSGITSFAERGLL